MSSLFTKKVTFSNRIVGISMGASHVFLSAMLAPLIFFGVWLAESVLRTYTGYTFDLAFSGEVRAQMVVLLFVSLVSITVAAMTLRSVFRDRMNGGIAQNYSVATMVVAGWGLALWIAGDARGSYGGFSQEVLVTLFALLPVLHFFLLRFLVRKLR